jgi:small redox-active disulfide protein 2
MSKELGKKIVRGNSVSIVGLETILQEVASMGIDGEDQLKDELLQRTRVQNYIPESTETRYSEALLRAYREFMGEEVEREATALTIKILGPGCLRCEQLAAEMKNALADLQLTASVEHVLDPGAISKYGFLATPALIINGQVRSSGRIPSREKIKKWLQEYCP